MTRRAFFIKRTKIGHWIVYGPHPYTGKLGSVARCRSRGEARVRARVLNIRWKNLGWISGMAGLLKLARSK